MKDIENKSKNRDAAIKYTPVDANDKEHEDDRENVELRIQCETKFSELVGDAPKTFKSNKKFLYFAAIAANISALVCGVAMGWTSPVIPKLTGVIEPENNPLPSNLSSSEESWVGSLLPIGAILGPFAAGVAADKYGRKKTLVASVVPFVLSFLGFAYARSVNAFYVGRFLIGLGVGGVFTVLPMYVGEISEDSVRGALGSFMQLFIMIGLFFAYAIGPYTSVSYFNLLCAVPPLIFILLFFMYVPESPYYLLAVEDKVAAEKALKKLRSSSSVERELEIMQKTVEDSFSSKTNFTDLFKSKGLTKALIISLGLVLFQQLSGIIVILFYTQNIFLATGSTIPADVSAIIVGIVQILGSFITPIFVDKRGKRFLLLISSLGMTISEGILGYYFYLKDSGSDVKSIFWLPIVCLIAYMITYCSGFGPLPWAVLGELFPSNIKSTASTFTASFCWALSFLLSKFFVNVVDAIGIAGSFWVFTVCCVVSFFFVYKCVPETSGKSLEEIQDILNGTEK